jgi:F-type H+-transporting ATPase subunit b
MFALIATVADNAQAAAASLEVAAPSAASELAHRFGVEGKYVLMQAVSFVIVLVVLYRFAIKPTLSQMDERNRQIEAGLKNAADTAAKLAEANVQAAAQLKAAQVESNKIVDEARKAAKELSERETAAAAERANALLKKANEAAELERKKIMAEAQQEIARLVVATTERVLAKKLTDSDRAAYNEAAARELTNV